jgi:hypothetical protein
MEAPSTDAMKTGRRECTSSEEVSMNKDTNPNIQILRGNWRWAGWFDST